MKREEEELRKAAFWNEWFRKDEQLVKFAEEGMFSYSMAFIRPNDFEHVKEVCSGGEGQFEDFEEFMSTLFWLKEGHRGDFWKVTDSVFIVDDDDMYPVSDETVDGMIQYILENSMFDIDIAHAIQKRFNADYDKHVNVAVNADQGETDEELPEG